MNNYNTTVSDTAAKVVSSTDPFQPMNEAALCLVEVLNHAHNILTDMGAPLPEGGRIGGSTPKDTVVSLTDAMAESSLRLGMLLNRLEWVRSRIGRV